jgi:predicted HTH domain antitoxin
MTLTLPDVPAVTRRSEAELRLELACALYAQGKISRVTGADIAGVDFFTFQGALGDRGIPIYTRKMLEEDMAALEKLFPE